jgi:hypothetical protein
MQYMIGQADELTSGLMSVALIARKSPMMIRY